MTCSIYCEKLTCKSYCQTISTMNHYYYLGVFLIFFWQFTSSETNLLSWNLNEAFDAIVGNVEFLTKHQIVSQYKFVQPEVDASCTCHCYYGGNRRPYVNPTPSCPIPNQEILHCANTSDCNIGQKTTINDFHTLYCPDEYIAVTCCQVKYTGSHPNRHEYQALKFGDSTNMYNITFQFGDGNEISKSYNVMESIADKFLISDNLLVKRTERNESWDALSHGWYFTDSTCSDLYRGAINDNEGHSNANKIGWYHYEIDNLNTKAKTGGITVGSFEARFSECSNSSSDFTWDLNAVGYYRNGTLKNRPVYNRVTDIKPNVKKIMCDNNQTVTAYLQSPSGFRKSNFKIVNVTEENGPSFRCEVFPNFENVVNVTFLRRNHTVVYDYLIYRHFHMESFYERDVVSSRFLNSSWPVGNDAWLCLYPKGHLRKTVCREIVHIGSSRQPEK